MEAVIDVKNNPFVRYHINYFYHMTHIDNVASILKHGLLSHTNSFVKQDISNHSVNSRRARREPIYYRSIHSYVPFYFNPKNAMLYARRDMQEDIVILVFDKSIFFEDGAIFTDGNASADATRFFKNPNDLDKLNWDCIFYSEYWNDFVDGKRQRMAELLVPNRVSSSKIAKIICSNSGTKRVLERLTNIRIEVNPYQYF